MQDLCPITWTYDLIYVQQRWFPMPLKKNYLFNFFLGGLPFFLHSWGWFLFLFPHFLHGIQSLYFQLLCKSPSPTLSKAKTWIKTSDSDEIPSVVFFLNKCKCEVWKENEDATFTVNQLRLCSIADDSSSNPATTNKFSVYISNIHRIRCTNFSVNIYTSEYFYQHYIE